MRSILHKGAIMAMDGALYLGVGLGVGLGSGLVLTRAHHT